MNDKIHLTVSDFEPANASDFELCIELTSNTYNYSIIDTVNKTVKVISSAQTSIFNDIEGNLLQTHFAKTKISLITQKFTFIPNSLFDPNNLAVYNKYIAATESETMLFRSLADTEITIIYAFEKHLIDKIEKHFPAAIIYPQISSFFKGVHFAFSLIKDNQIFANFKADYLEISVFKAGEFQFYNIFSFENEDEILYFLLLVCQQQQLNAANVMLKISGDISTNSNTYKKITEQFKRTEITDQDSLPLTSLGIQTPVMPRFFSLLSLHLCE